MCTAAAAAGHLKRQVLRGQDSAGPAGSSDCTRWRFESGPSLRKKLTGCALTSQMLKMLSKQVLQDLQPLLLLARKRCQDDKGTVRKAALGLLEALMAAQLAMQRDQRPEGWALCSSTVAAAAADALVSLLGAQLRAV